MCIYTHVEKDWEMGMNISREDFHARSQKKMGLYDKDFVLMTYLDQAKHLRLGLRKEGRQVTYVGFSAPPRSLRLPPNGTL